VELQLIYLVFSKLLSWMVLRTRSDTSGSSGRGACAKGLATQARLEGRRHFPQRSDLVKAVWGSRTLHMSLTSSD
jgi:hypothetical protein